MPRGTASVTYVSRKPEVRDVTPRYLYLPALLFIFPSLSTFAMATKLSKITTYSSPISQTHFYSVTEKACFFKGWWFFFPKTASELKQLKIFLENEHAQHIPYNLLQLFLQTTDSFTIYNRHYFSTSQSNYVIHVHIQYQQVKSLELWQLIKAPTALLQNPAQVLMG